MRAAHVSVAADMEPAVQAFRRVAQSLEDCTQAFADLALALGPYPTNADDATAIMAALRERFPLRRFLMPLWWQSVYVLHQAMRFADPRCHDCDAWMTDEERWAYGHTCEQCERAWWEMTR